MEPDLGRKRNVWRGLGLLACLLFACSTLPAETKLYTLQIPANKPANFELPLPIEHAGTLILRAEWSLDRLLAFRLEHPAAGSPTRKSSGPSPLFLEVEIEPRQLGTGPWMLSIHADPSGEGGEALLTVELPEPPGTEPALPMLKKSAPPPPPPPDPWMVSRTAPAGSPEAWRRTFDSIEKFRALLDSADADSAIDSCRWQVDLMRYLAARRDELADSGAFPAELTRSVLLDIAGAIRSVEEMRTSPDALIAGPPPDDPGRRQHWLAFRKERFQPLEQALDDILQTLQRGHAPALEQEGWPVRLVSCLTACERYFEERTRLGEHQATNREIAIAQWERLLAAAGALHDLATVAPLEP
jgi:hypothetical protein